MKKDLGVIDPLSMSEDELHQLRNQLIRDLCHEFETSSIDEVKLHEVSVIDFRLMVLSS